jgi:hypothetical protein
MVVTFRALFAKRSEIGASKHPNPLVKKPPTRAKRAITNDAVA